MSGISLIRVFHAFWGMQSLYIPEIKIPCALSGTRCRNIASTLDNEDSTHNIRRTVMWYRLSTKTGTSQKRKPTMSVRVLVLFFRDLRSNTAQRTCQKYWQALRHLTDHVSDTTRGNCVSAEKTTDQSNISWRWLNVIQETIGLVCDYELLSSTVVHILNTSVRSTVVICKFDNYPQHRWNS
jgi:hypothetical protein